MMLFAIASLLSMAQPIQAQSTGVEQIRILPVPKTPEANTVQLVIALPKIGEGSLRNPVWVQFRLDGYPLGTGTNTQRADEIPVSPLGQSVHVVVDNNPYFPIVDQSIDPFNEDGFYFDTSFKFQIPYSLPEGIHTLRMFPARSYGESLKHENTYQVSYFYVGTKGNGPDTDLMGPYLTYNEPSNHMPLTEKKPVLLDFYISNCELTPDGYKVRVIVDGTAKRTLTSWQPYYIYGMKSGTHTVRLQLIDELGEPVPGVFNDIERTIYIH